MTINRGAGMARSLMVPGRNGCGTGFEAEALRDLMRRLRPDNAAANTRVSARPDGASFVTSGDGVTNPHRHSGAA
jgi:hypothetical protein